MILLPNALVAVEKTLYGFDRLYTYIIPETLSAACKPGARVLLPFGRGKTLRQGIIYSVSEYFDGTEEEAAKLKSIQSAPDPEPVLTEDLIRLAGELRDRCFCTYFEAARVMLPSGLMLRTFETLFLSPLTADSDPEDADELDREVLDRVRKKDEFVPRSLLLEKTNADDDRIDSLIKRGYLIRSSDTRRRANDASVRLASLAPEFSGDTDLPFKLTPKQSQVVEFLKTVPSASTSEICYYTGVTAAVIENLRNRGIVVYHEEQIYRSPGNMNDIERDTSGIDLTPAQADVFKGISEMSESGGTVLLWGVTGSGKTRIYMRLIDSILRDGGDVIFMVPEIALTPQMLALFYARYGSDVAVIHSALSVGERLDEWKRIRSGNAKIVVGTRSAVFAPLSSLRAIIIDEEQSESYKSEITPRYHCRDVARLRCSFSNATLILGSATPSLESFSLAKAGKYRLFTLPERYAPGGLPDVITVDSGNKKEMGGRVAVSETLRRELESNIENGEQSILLINRRGFNTFIACNKCKKVVTCPNCSISLTYHSANNRLMCHYCGYSAPVSPVCPYCGGDAVRFSGAGTQRVEMEVAGLFPQARLLRMDADTTSAKNAHKVKFEAFGNGEYDIMIGTQMVSKGLDFPNVTLVGVISVDGELYNDDYGGSERTFDLLTQVIGRAGRGERRGRAVIQTFNPENELLALAARQDYGSFFDTEIQIRRNLGYPPWCDLCVFLFRGTNEGRVAAGAREFFRLLRIKLKTPGAPGMIILGPSAPAAAKLNNTYRQRLIVKCRNNKQTRELFSGVLAEFGEGSKYKDVVVRTDMNPANLF